jgi:phosphoribosylamine--glycine ligase
VLFEEGLRGEELSFIILTDGKDFVRMAPTRDHKRAFDGDEGPNTGGMGAYSTDDILPAELEKKIVETIVRPTLAGLHQDGMAYQGFLYFGLMLGPNGPKVLEFNCRLGDPETQAIVMRAEFDFAQACMAAARGAVASVSTKWSPAASVCVVMASGGYPTSPKTGEEIHGLVNASGNSREGEIFHSGTRVDGNKYYTSGGRVLAVAAAGIDLAAARKSVYDICSRLSFSGAQFRTDIARSMEHEVRIAAETSNG